MTAGVGAEPLVAAAVSELRAAGFAGLPYTSVVGEVDGFFAWRMSADYVDTVTVRGEECAQASRVRNVFDLANPLAGSEVVWFEIGDLADVMAAVRELDQLSKTPRRVPGQRF